MISLGVVTASITVRSTDAERLVAELRSRVHAAYVGPAENGCLVVFERGSEDDLLELRVLVERISEALAAPALAVSVHDDRALLYFLAQAGACTDEYVSSPAYFEARETRPAGGDAARLQAAFAPGADPEAVRRVLERPASGDGDAEAGASYARETERHRDLVRVLGLPPWAVAVGFRAVDEGDTLPPGFPPAGLLRRVGR